MKQPLETVGITIQVTVGDFAAGLAWYEALLGRPPDADTPDGGARWEVVPYCWLDVTAGTRSGGQGPVRLGSADLARDRDRIRDATGVTVSEIQRVEGMLAYCDFTDPWGNRVGLFQDLSDVTNLS